MELVVASTVMMTALTSMAFVTTSAFGDIAMARERQSANALLDEAIEQLRALPYDTVSLGMRTSDLAGDPRVIGSGTTAAPYRLATTNERIVHVSTNQTIAPLVPNVSSRTIDNKVYAVRVYLTHFNDDPTSGAVTATAYVDWTSSGRNAGAASFLRVSTIIFSPAAASAGSSGACLSTATHPFSGPCLAFFYGSAAADGGQISMSGDGALGDAVNGLSLALPGTTSSMQVEQTTSVQGRAVAAGASIGTTRQGYEPTSSKADNDPASAGSLTHDSQTGSALSLSLSASGGISTISITGSGDAATSVSTTAASDTQICPNAPGTANLTDALPCGRVEAGLTSLGTVIDLGTLGLTSQLLNDPIRPVMISGMETIAHTDRETTSTAGVCSGTSSSGCIRSTASRSIDTLELGGLPGGQAFVKLEGFTSTLTAEAGINAAEPAVAAAGTLSVWNPSLLGLGLGGYDPVPVTFGSGEQILTRSITVNDFDFAGISLTVTVDLRTGSSATSSTATTCTTTLACRTRADATLGSPIIGTVTYRFALGSNVVSAVVSVDLGNLTASASYADPPSTA